MPLNERREVSRMNLSALAKVQDQTVRNILYAQQQKIESLEKEIMDLKRPPTALVGFKVGANSTMLETMFPRYKFKGGD